MTGGAIMVFLLFGDDGRYGRDSSRIDISENYQLMLKVSKNNTFDCNSRGRYGA